MHALFESSEIAGVPLRNRIVMAPMTRLRGYEDGTPQDAVVDFYRQRAGLGMLITEGIYPAPRDRSYPGQPGLATAANEAAWATVVAGVHEAGSVISAQLMAGGRATHSAITGTTPQGPSAIAVEGELHGPTGKVTFEVPDVMSADDIHDAISRTTAAARRAIAAGFDFVEIHGGNGYLVHQFLAANANERDDEYGGDPQRRAQFALDLMSALAGAVGADRVGIRLSPLGQIQGISEPDDDATWQTYERVVEGADHLGIAYVSIAHTDLDHPRLAALVDMTHTTVLLNHADFAVQTTLDTARRILDLGADFAVVGRPALANPDLVARWRSGAPLNPVRQEFVYANGTEGYTDYPVLEVSGQA